MRVEDIDAINLRDANDCKKALAQGAFIFLYKWFCGVFVGCLDLTFFAFMK